MPARPLTFVLNTGNSLYTGLLAAYLGNAPSGIGTDTTGTLYDSGASAYNGTLTNYTGVGNLPSNRWAFDATLGRYALAYNGSSDYVALPGKSLWDFGTGAFTIAAWFKTTFSGDYQDIVRYDNPINSAGVWLLQQTNTNRIAFTICGSSGTSGPVISAISPASYNDGNWHCAIGVRTGGYIYLYVDGSLVAGPVAESLNIVGNSNNVANIGNCGMYNEPWHGSIADTLIFTRALTTGEITTLATIGDPSLGGFVTTTPPIAARRRRLLLSGAA